MPTLLLPVHGISQAVCFCQVWYFLELAYLTASYYWCHTALLDQLQPHASHPAVLSTWWTPSVLFAIDFNFIPDILLYEVCMALQSSFFPVLPSCVSCQGLWAFCRKGSNRDIHWPDLWEKSIKNSVNTFLAFWYFLASANFWFTFWLFYFFYSLQKLIPISPASFPCSTLLMLYQIGKRWLPFLCL